MLNLKEPVLFQELQEIELGLKSQEDLKTIRRRLTNHFQVLGLNWKVKKSLSIVEQCLDREDNSYNTISDFLFYPVRKICFLNGEKEKEIGLRMRVIKRTKYKDIFRYVELDMSYECLQEGEWLNSKHIKHVFKGNTLQKHYNHYLSAIRGVEGKLLKNQPKVMLTSQLGWSHGSEKWHFVPITPSDKREVIYDETLVKQYNIRDDSELSTQQDFLKVLNMLDITNKDTTLALLSFTFLSLFTSLIGYSSPKMTKFMMCLYGNKQYRYEIANIFCNLFDRRSNMSSLNENYHSNLNSSEEEFRSKASKIRDGVFIINTEQNPRKISMAKKFMLRDEFDNMFLILNEDPVDQDFVLNLNINEVNQVQFNEVKKEPAILTTCITYFIYYCREKFSLDGGNKKRLRRMLLKIYNNNQKHLENSSHKLDINKVHYYSCLLIGFSFFLQYGIKIKAIEKETGERYFSEAIELFQKQCVVSTSLMDAEKENNEIHVLFLEKLLNLLQIHELPHLTEKNNFSIDNTNNLGWNDDNNTVYIRASIFKTIEELLNAGGYKIKLKKVDIYKKLYENRVIIEPDGKKLEKVQVTKLEKSLNVASKPSTVKVFILDKQNAIDRKSVV